MRKDGLVRFKIDYSVSLEQHGEKKKQSSKQERVSTILVSIIEVFYHHRASVWGVSISNNYVITGSMDGTIGLIDIRTMTLKKHFMAHQGEWGGNH